MNWNRYKSQFNNAVDELILADTNAELTCQEAKGRKETIRKEQKRSEREKEASGETNREIAVNTVHQTKTETPKQEVCCWFGYRYTSSPHTHIYSCTPS
jgi:hypothetical protein